jgi:hypothetical protein
MAWTNPITWATNRLVTALDLNEQLRDNLSWLYSRPKAQYVNNGASYSTTSTTMVNVDGTNLSLTLACTGGSVLVNVTATVMVTGTAWTDRVNIGVTRDGSLLALRAQATRYGNDNNRINVSFSFYATADAGNRTFNLQWSIYGATQADMVQVAFWVQEIG